MGESVRGGTGAAPARTDYPPTEATLTVQALVDRYRLAGRGRCYPVVAGQELLGLITLTDIRRLERDDWPSTTVYRVMTPFERLRTVSPTDSATEALQKMAQMDVNQVPLLHGRLLVGILSRGDVLRLRQSSRYALIES